jgi:dephospho-CoA kinase
MMRLVGLAGKARSGKTTVARFLCGAFDWREVSLADPIRAGLSAMLGIEPYVMSDPVRKNEVLAGMRVSARELMQTLGTEWGRKLVDDRVWIRQATASITAIRQSDPFVRGVVVSDIRFANEAEWIRSLGGQVWHIGDRKMGGSDNLPATAASHASEAGITRDERDVFIDNSGSLDDLYDAVMALHRAL